jgi:Protein of unknown function (DUF2608)
MAIVEISKKQSIGCARFFKEGKNMFLRKSLFILSLIPSFVLGEIRECDTIEILLDYADPDTLIVCDVDNTLIEAAQHLGSSHCGYYFLEKFIKMGFSEQEASELQYSRWLLLQPRILIRPVDAKAPVVLQRLRQLGISTLGLTARDQEELAYTHRQLASVQIELKDHVSAEERIQLPFKFPAIYYQSIIFCGDWNKKGEVLASFLKHVNYFPRRVVFIDDRLDHVKDVERTMLSLGIECISIRFSGSDAAFNDFDPKIADLQWELFPLIISDEKAHELIYPPSR